MSMQDVLIARALVWFLIGIAMFVSLSYQTPEEKKAGKREKKTMRIIVSIAGIIIVGIGVADIIFAISPHLETRDLELVGMSTKRMFEASCSFEDENEVLSLDVPSDVARNDLTDLLSEGTWYTVTYETRSKVVVKIHELE
ncbi:MAG: hypothetical protein IJ771_01490 [Clostridia bacterium]|nr:hypothetical protein [Clostridia bacterium]